MNSLEAGVLGQSVLVGKSSPAPEFSTPNRKYAATAAQLGICHWVLWALARLGTGMKKLQGPKQCFKCCWT